MVFLRNLEMDAHVAMIMEFMRSRSYINDHRKIRIARIYSDSIVGFVLHHLRIISLDIWRPAMKKKKIFSLARFFLRSRNVVRSR